MFAANYHIILLSLCLLVFKAFDRDNDSFVNMEDWVKGLSVFLRGSLEEQMHCKFQQCPTNKLGSRYWQKQLPVKK